MPTTIIGIGTALPNYSISQIESCTHAKACCCETEPQKRILEQLYKKTEIKSRSSVLIDKSPDGSLSANLFPGPTTISDKGPSTQERMQLYMREAAQLALASSSAAIQNAGIDATTISHLITVSCTGFSAPGFDLYLVNELGLQRSIFRTHIGFMGCHGAFNALRVAHGFIQSDPRAVVLLCATELCSIHFQYGWDTDGLISNSLFADGSAALVITNSYSSPKYLSSKSWLVPNSEKAMTWSIGNNGFSMTLDKNVPSLIQSHLPNFIEGWLAENNLSLPEINGWAIHPGGPRILEAVENALVLPSIALKPSREILSEYGNMSSPTVLFILERMLTLGKQLPYIMLGFGPGLTIEATLLA